MVKSRHTELEGERALVCCLGMAYKDSSGQKSGVFYSRLAVGDVVPFRRRVRRQAANSPITCRQVTVSSKVVS